MKYAPSADPAVVVPPPIPAPRAAGTRVLRRHARSLRITGLICLAAAALWIAASIILFAAGVALWMVTSSAVVAALWAAAAIGWLALAARPMKRGTR